MATEVKGHHRVVAKSFFISRPEALGEKDAKASRHTRDPAEDQEGQRSGGSHRRQGIDTQETAHDDGVHQVVYILKNISQQYGNGKENDQPKRAAFCHVVLHKIFLFSSKITQVLVLRFTNFALYFEYRIVCSL